MNIKTILIILVIIIVTLIALTNALKTYEESDYILDEDENEETENIELTTTIHTNNQINTHITTTQNKSIVI